MIASVETLVSDLGGTTKTSEIAGVDPRVVSNWKMRGRIPGEYFLVLSGAATQPCDPAIFGIKAAAEARA